MNKLNIKPLKIIFFNNINSYFNKNENKYSTNFFI